MASFSRVRAPACAFAAARPPSEAPSLSAITGLPAARAALRVYFTRPGARKLAHYVEREVTRLFAARSAPIALPSQPATPDANAPPGQPALRPLAGGILGRHRSIARRPPARARPWSMRSPRERWSRASRLTPPYTRTRLAALPMCKSNSFHFLP
jgi:hypothetical protein